MVNEKVKIRYKYRLLKKIFKILIILIIVVIILAAAFFLGFFSNKSKIEYVLENPLKNIILANTQGNKINYEKVIEQSTLEFNEDYINYILITLGVNNLHSSLLGYGNPRVEFVLDSEFWNSEINDGNLITKKGSIEKKDIIIKMSKEDAVKALLSENIEEFMKNSVKSDNTKIEFKSNVVELGSKGYLQMYKELTGKEIG